MASSPAGTTCSPRCAAAGPDYRLRPTDLTNATMLTSSGTTKRLDKLEQAGLIRREADPADRRGTLITLTPAGRELIDRSPPPTSRTSATDRKRSTLPSRTRSRTSSVSSF